MVKHTQESLGSVACTVLLATVLWFISFYLDWLVFWYKISVSAIIMAGLSLLLQKGRYDRLNFNSRTILVGIGSAGVLYGVFYAGKMVSTFMLPFAAQQIQSIYGKGNGTPLWTIMLLLCFITGPAEELYWRGFLQKNLMNRFGGWQGWLLSTAVYSGVHIGSFNFMLIGAAAVAGAFWGAMYWRFKDLTPVIISHAIWSSVIFAVRPMG